MKIDTIYQEKTSSFAVRDVAISRPTDDNNTDNLYTTETLSYLTCPKKRIALDAKKLKKLILKDKIHPALKAFIELECNDSSDSLTEILNFCRDYDLLLDLDDYQKYLSKSMGYKTLSDSYKQRLSPAELSDTVSMPICLFFFYKRLFDNICKLHEYIQRIKEHPLQKNTLFEELVISYFDLLFQPYFFNLPEPYNHHFTKITPLSRFSIHYANYIEDHCMYNHALNPETFWDVAQEAFRINTGLQKIAALPGHGTVLREHFSKTEYIERPRIETYISYCSDNLLETLRITDIFAQDLISDDYQDIFTILIPTLRKYHCIKIADDYSLDIHINDTNDLKIDKLTSIISTSGNLLINQILSSYTSGLSLTLSEDVKDDELDNDVLVLNVENLLQFLSINLLYTLPTSSVRKCIYKKCDRYILSHKNSKTCTSRCCSNHYAAQKKYMKRHNLTMDDFP